MKKATFSFGPRWGSHAFKGLLFFRRFSLAVHKKIVKTKKDFPFVPSRQEKTPRREAVAVPNAVEQDAKTTRFKSLS